MKKHQAGFSIVAAMGLSGMLMIAAIGIMAMQKSIDDETRHTAIKHARYMAEDILKTQVAIKTQQAASRAEITTFVNSIRDVNSTNKLKIPVPGTDCGNNTACTLVVLSSDPATIPPGSTTISVVLGIPPEQSKYLKFKVAPITVKLNIPSQNQIDSGNNQGNGSYSCPVSKPIFKGLKKQGSNLQADCRAVADFSPQGQVLDVKCDVSQGKWMKNINSNLVPECVDFASEQRVPASVEICPNSGQYSKSYSLDSKFNISNQTCVSKGNPYDFVSKEN